MGTISWLGSKLNAIKKAIQDIMPDLIDDNVTWSTPTTASKNQAAPVQNDWYTILDTTENCRILFLSIVVQTTGETLEAKITVDGVVWTGTIVSTNDVWYFAGIYEESQTNNLLFDTTRKWERSYLIEGRSVKIEFRKTTAAGAGNIIGVVKYTVR